MAEAIKRMDIKEFREKGFLQEANRLFFHPHGLALEVVVNGDGTEHLGGVWDYRDDAEGIIFVEVPDLEKALAVEEERNRHVEARVALMNAAIQPLNRKIEIPIGRIGDHAD